jgi:hypothetical protein
MSVIQSYPFNSQADYSVNNVVVTGGVAKLGLVNNPGAAFVESFDASAGFTYDSAKAEFAASLLRQKDQRPANQTFFATFDQGSVNANWGAGTLAPTNNGAVLISGALEMLGGVSSKYVDFVGTANADSLQTGCVRVKIKPNYSGTPATNQNFFSISRPTIRRTIPLAVPHNRRQHR